MTRRYDYSGSKRKSPLWAEFVRQVRKRMGCNRRELAELIGRSHAYVSRWERHGWVPSFYTCETFAEKLMINKLAVLTAAGYLEPTSAAAG